jgi:hypothetical protein
MPEKKTAKKPKPLTAAKVKLITLAEKIAAREATALDAAYIARALVLASLPHSNPGDEVKVWSRTNGDVTLGIQPGWNYEQKKSFGFPYGSIPRLLLFWITTEAIRTKERRIELGSSLSGFMAELGLSSTTGRGPRGDATRLREQMDRLFRSRFSLITKKIDDNGVHKDAWLDMQIASGGEYWWTQSSDQDVLWKSWIELGEGFFKAVTSAPVPMDIRALQALKQSPLALDLYAWLTYEAYRANKGCKARFETWEQLNEHLGGGYADIRDFRKKVKEALGKIQAVYPGLKLGSKRGGVEILPASYPALLPSVKRV